MLTYPWSGKGSTLEDGVCILAAGAGVHVPGLPDGVSPFPACTHGLILDDALTSDISLKGIELGVMSAPLSLMVYTSSLYPWPHTGPMTSSLSGVPLLHRVI